ncbi:MAG: DNA cytosine methyltransferase [Dethiobacteria bacterium]
MKAGALFAGIGGFCLGFKQVGIKTIWAVENDPAAVETYTHNLKDVRIITNNGKPASIKKVSVLGDRLEPVDVLHAGFPCQSFSQAGRRKGFRDPRGRLLFEVIRIVKEFGKHKPSVLVLENTPNFRNGEGGSWFIELMKEIRKLGYWFRNSSCAELDTFFLTELPQKRNRLYMLAFSMDRFPNGRFVFPNKFHQQKKRLSDFINFDGFIDDDSYYLPTENRYYQMIKREEVDKNVIYHLRKYIVRTKEPDICPTLTANMGLGGHNVPFVFDAKGLRKLTEYECLSLQGFPQDYVFPDSVPRYKRYMQVGNAVTVPVVALLASKVKKKLERSENGA